MEYFHIVLVVLFCCSLLTQVESTTNPHNVDMVEPFIIRPPSSADTSDGFGWSSVFHQLQTPLSNDDFLTALSRVRVLVGAPRGSAVDSNVNNTGVVYSCRISTGGACEGIRGNTALYMSGGNNLANQPGEVFQKEGLFPPMYSEGRLYDQTRDVNFTLTRDTVLVSESKSGQLMGSNLISTGSNVLACGSSWNYVFPETMPLNPAVQSDFSVYRPWGICFLGNQQLQNFMTVSPCLRSTDFPNQRICTGGISSVIANNRVYVGAPTIGPYNGQVRAVGINDLNNTNGYSEASVGGANFYYGFEVGSGFLSQQSGSGTENIVATSIRYQSDTASPRVGAVFDHSQTAMPLAVGQQLAESFGYSVALVDLNGDGYDELVAGAPMYSLLEQLRVECGRVFIYYNNGGILNVTHPHIIVGPFGRMRLGLKVVNGGDLNSDGISDLIVSAPYEPSSESGSSSTGAIYVYHGFQDRAEFENQTPQRIHADDIVSAVTDVTTLTTFGFSVSARFDADKNSHADIVVGGYENQVVTVLRTRPFANVQVEFGEIPDVNLITDSSFDVRITANYSSADPSLTGARTFGFRLTEQTTATTPARLFFTGGNREYSGTLSFDGSQMASQTVTVFFDGSGDPTIPYQLTFSLVDVEKPEANLTRTGRVLDQLNSLPRFRLIGNPNIAVNLSDLCNGDGCQSDVVVTPVQNSYTIVAGETQAADFVVTYTNLGPEEARGLQVVISDIPTAIFEENIAVVNTVTGGQSQGLTCTTNSVDGKRNATCDIVDRFNRNETRNLTISIQLSLNEITSELGFPINVHILTDMTGNNSDANPSNNMANVNFTLESRSDISVSVSFPQERLTYSAVAPTSVSSGLDLGVSETLTVRVSNAGPSTILNARVSIYFPARSSITGNNFFLYPTALIFDLGMTSTDARTNVTCSQMNIDPANLGTNSQNRRKRSSVPVRARREVSRGARLPRQAATTNLDCSASPMACTMFVCNISRLTTAFVDVLLDYTVDERFFSSQAIDMEYFLTVLADVEVLDEFQSQGDNRSNDRSSDTVTLTPPVAEGGPGALFYVAIILPIVIGLILIVIVGFLLYYFGFFRRKKPEDSEELEPVPAENGPPGQAPAAPPKTPGEDVKEEITKV